VYHQIPDKLSVIKNFTSQTIKYLTRISIPLHILPLNFSATKKKDPWILLPNVNSLTLRPERYSSDLSSHVYFLFNQEQNLRLLSFVIPTWKWVIERKMWVKLKPKNWEKEEKTFFFFILSSFLNFVRVMILKFIAFVRPQYVHLRK